jgi:hypothetical protein
MHTPSSSSSKHQRGNPVTPSSTNVITSVPNSGGTNNTNDALRQVLFHDIGVSPPTLGFMATNHSTMHSTLNLGLSCLTVSEIVELDVGDEVVIVIKESSPVLFKYKAVLLNQMKSQLRNATAYDQFEAVHALMHEQHSCLQMGQTYSMSLSSASTSIRNTQMCMMM